MTASVRVELVAGPADGSRLMISPALLHPAVLLSVAGSFYRLRPGQSVVADVLLFDNLPIEELLAMPTRDDDDRGVL